MAALVDGAQKDKQKRPDETQAEWERRALTQLMREVGGINASCINVMDRIR